MVDTTQYSVGVLAEDLALYSPGGYHPIHINDRLKDGRYEIVNKLGFGSFSTVWLARDHQEQTNVSIKVVVANKSHQQERELEILQFIGANGDRNHQGWKHVSQFLDSFFLNGPNGQHLCIVMELLGPKVSIVAKESQGSRLNVDLARQISRQLLLAVDFLHSCNICHGDIYMSNVLFRLPKSKRSTAELAKAFGSPSVGEISRKDGSPLEENFPRYLVEPLEYDLVDIEHLEEIKLADFGESFFSSAPPKLISTPLPLHPPELVFQHSLTKAVDIWNLGCTTFQLVTGRSPFETDFDDRVLIPQFQKVVGGLPVDWVLEAMIGGVLKDGLPGFFAADSGPLDHVIRKSCFNGCDKIALHLDEQDIEKLVQYLKKALVVDPALRSNTQQLLTEPWVLESTF